MQPFRRGQLESAYYPFLAIALAGGLLMSLPALPVRAQARKPRIARPLARAIRQNTRAIRQNTRALRRQSVQNPNPTPQRLQSVPNPNPTAQRLPGAKAVVTPRGNLAANVDPRAWPLLAKMYRPAMNYEGVEVSNVSTNGAASEETIWGDTNGRTRREYLAPSKLEGDVILTAPNQSYQYHHQEHQLLAAHWPVDQGDKLARLRLLAKAGRVRIQVTGEEMIAGRSAVAISISALNSGEEGEARRVLYLDKETGIRLRIDRYNSAGQQISTTYLKNITVGTPADPQKFDPRSLPQVETLPLFPAGQPMFPNVAQARTQAGFAIKEPTLLPAGYALDGVWVFGENPRVNRVSALLRYSSGVNHFSLFETLVPPNKNAVAVLPRPGAFRPRRVPGGMAWRDIVPEGDLNIIYTGHLPATDFQALQSSIH